MWLFDKNTSKGSVESGLGAGECPVPSVPAQEVTCHKGVDLVYH